MKKELGQVLVLLIVIMTVALATGLSIIQKSISDISTASKAEQSSRAFSAAEAGIEKALRSEAGSVVGSVSFDNNAQATIDQSSLPPAPGAGREQLPLEYPPLAKEDVVQVWLANPNEDDPATKRPKVYYNPPSNQLKVYWGTPRTVGTNKPAISIKVIYYDGSTYNSVPFYLDSASSRTTAEGFERGVSDSSDTDCSRTIVIPTTSGNNRKFACQSTLTMPDTVRDKDLMLVRLRFLYSSISHPLAVGGAGNCGCSSTDCCLLPRQARNIYATGTAGEAQRRLKVFQEEKVVPNYFDYALFSAGEINK